MPKCRMMGAGLAGSLAYKDNTNGNQGGGNKKQGLAPTTNKPVEFVLPAIQNRAYSENRNLVFCMNQLGGVGAAGIANKSRMFATTADGVKDCVPTHPKSSSSSSDQDVVNETDTIAEEVGENEGVATLILQRSNDAKSIKLDPVGVQNPGNWKTLYINVTDGNWDAPKFFDQSIFTINMDNVSAQYISPQQGQQIFASYLILTDTNADDPNYNNYDSHILTLKCNPKSVYINPMSDIPDAWMIGPNNTTLPTKGGELITGRDYQWEASPSAWANCKPPTTCAVYLACK